VTYLVVVGIGYAFESIENHLREIVEVRFLPLILVQDIEQEDCDIATERGPTLLSGLDLDAISVALLGPSLG